MIILIGNRKSARNDGHNFRTRMSIFSINKNKIISLIFEMIDHVYRNNFKEKCMQFFINIVISLRKKQTKKYITDCNLKILKKAVLIVINYFSVTSRQKKYKIFHKFIFASVPKLFKKRYIFCFHNVVVVFFLLKK